MGINHLVHNIKPKNITTSRPGRVGSVGEVQVRTRFRQSCAEMPWAIDPYWTGKRAHKLGSNVQDGHTTSYNGGGPASTTQKGWNGNRSFKHQYGYSIHDVQSADLLTEPIVSPLGKFGWRRKIARVKNVKGGSLFMPMGYKATGKPRGGLYPTTEGFGGITPASVSFNPENDSPPETDPNGPIPLNPLRAGPTRQGVQRLGVRMEGLRV